MLSQSHCIIMYLIIPCFNWWPKLMSWLILVRWPATSAWVSSSRRACLAWSSPSEDLSCEQKMSIVVSTKNSRWNQKPYWSTALGIGNNSTRKKKTKMEYKSKLNISSVQPQPKNHCLKSLIILLWKFAETAKTLKKKVLIGTCMLEVCLTYIDRSHLFVKIALLKGKIGVNNLRQTRQGKA